MIDLKELRDIRQQLTNISHNARKNKVERRIQTLIDGMIQAIDSIVRLTNISNRKKQRDEAKQEENK